MRQTIVKLDPREKYYFISSPRPGLKLFVRHLPAEVWHGRFVPPVLYVHGATFPSPRPLNVTSRLARGTHLMHLETTRSRAMTLRRFWRSTPRDAHFESPLVPHLLGGASGVLNGHEELRRLFSTLAERKPPVRQYDRTGYLTDGKRLIWEYPRDAGRGEQMDFVEAMELNEDGLIQRHCVYWGSFGVRVLQRDEYHR